MELALSSLFSPVSKEAVRVSCRPCTVPLGEHRCPQVANEGKSQRSKYVEAPTWKQICLTPSAVLSTKPHCPRRQKHRGRTTCSSSPIPFIPDRKGLLGARDSKLCPPHQFYWNTAIPFFMYCLWLLSHLSGQVIAKETTWPAKPKYLLSGPLQKSLLMSGLERESVNRTKFSSLVLRSVGYGGGRKLAP